MINRYFDPGAQRADKVRALFSHIAPRYDLINDLQSFGLHRRWKRMLINMAVAGRGRKALDVCCGTGDLALGLAGRGLHVTGLDFSEPMLQIARQRAQKRGLATSKLSRSETAKVGHTSERTPTEQAPQTVLPSVDFVPGDAQNLLFADCSFDIVTVGYGLRNLADWQKGLREMHRVARPGGRLLVLDFGKPENRLWRAVYFTYLRAIVPMPGLLFCGNASAYAYILESLQHYPAQQGVAARMREMGLAEVRVINFLGGVMSINYGEKRVR